MQSLNHLDFWVKHYDVLKMASWNCIYSMEVQNYARPEFRPPFGLSIHLIYKNDQKQLFIFTPSTNFIHVDTSLIPHQKHLWTFLKIPYFWIIVLATGKFNLFNPCFRSFHKFQIIFTPHKKLMEHITNLIPCHIALDPKLVTKPSFSSNNFYY